MSVIEYNQTENSAGQKTLVVTAKRQHLIFGPAHPGQAQALDAIKHWVHGDMDADEAIGIIDEVHSPAKIINTALREVSPRFAYFNGRLRFDGDVVDKTITRLMLDRLKAGDNDWRSLAHFMLKLANNPSADSRRALYRWISDRHLTLTQEGMIVGYKGVTVEGTSGHSGKGIIHSQDAEGLIDTEFIEHDRLPNVPGTWVEFPRAEIDPDPNNGCSVGLHVGTKAYAENYLSRLLTVLVDPSAVVMVPKDCDGQKMRVHQYYITDIEPAKAEKEHTLQAHTAFDLDDDEEDFDDFFDDDEIDIYNYESVDGQYRQWYG
ncbi:MAG: hypothetical protein HLX51_00705 [Micrococcaceae bacterium]|nr:hypothetical protein [Micrococcaceae bacterium]